MVHSLSALLVFCIYITTAVIYQSLLLQIHKCNCRYIVITMLLLLFFFLLVNLSEIFRINCSFYFPSTCTSLLFDGLFGLLLSLYRLFSMIWLQISSFVISKSGRNYQFIFLLVQNCTRSGASLYMGTNVYHEL